MQTRLTLKPGQKGTRKLQKEYGDRLVCVRYRYDARRKKRYKTVELIVETVDWEEKSSLPDPAKKVAVKINWGEWELGVRVRRAGGVWNAQHKVWELEYRKVDQLGLTDRIVDRENGM